MLDNVTGVPFGFKIQTVVLSYLSAAKKLDIYPTMISIQEEIPRHFMQEFALDTQMFGRYETFGVTSEDEFLEALGRGRYNLHAPSVKEITTVLEYMQFPFFDHKGNVHHSVIQEVW